jgi:hypothetical protein
VRIKSRDQLALCSPHVRAHLERELEQLEAAGQLPDGFEAASSSSSAPAEPTDEKGRPMTHWGGKQPRRAYPEEAAGRAIVQWADLLHIDHPALGRICVGHYLAHNANGGARTAAEAGILIGQGVRPGWPDYTLYVPVDGFHGLVLELKADDGAKPNADQLNILLRLERAGYKAAVAWGAAEACAAIERYLGPRK